MGYHTITQCIESLLTKTVEKYLSERSSLGRWWHQDQETLVYLSDDLYRRMCREEGRAVVHLSLERPVRVLQASHPSIHTNIVIDMHQHFPAGYDAYHYGLNPALEKTA